jgi:hypothetical protein
MFKPEVFDLTEKVIPLNQQECKRPDSTSEILAARNVEVRRQMAAELIGQGLSPAAARRLLRLPPS